MFALWAIIALLIVVVGLVMYPSVERGATMDVRLGRLTTGFAVAGCFVTSAILSLIYFETVSELGSVAVAALGFLLVLASSVLVARRVARRILGAAASDFVVALRGVAVALAAQATTAVVGYLFVTVVAIASGREVFEVIGSTAAMVGVFFMFGLPAVLIAGLAFGFMVKKLEGT